MAFRQVKELLQWVCDFHESLAVRYATLASEQDNERMKMALDFLANRERRMRQNIARYLEDDKTGALDTWLIDTSDFVHPRVLDRIPHCVDCRDVQDILANAMAANQTLKDMYRMRGELAQVPSEAQLFTELMNNQDAEMRLQVRDIGRLEMY
ncbi:MAG: hypothetical protein RJQ10_05835 [Haliea sp.]|uniref:hypothetical protein n=1 Tax=Haliea sp. TaxID=1932666 RepID=UPI0032ECF4B3